MKVIYRTIGLIVLVSLLQSCMYDLRSKTIKKNGITADNTIKGKEILNRAWKKQGYDKLKNHSVYSYHGSDTWKGLFGRMGSIWPDLKSELELKFELGSFDGQVAFVDGQKKGTIAGLQNWNYYEISKGETVFSDKEDRKNRRKVFGISAFQYFTEMIDRIKDAPIVSYAGEKEFRGNQYDLVFCSWETEKPHMGHDQYVAWINKNTGLMEFTQYTIRESYLKLPGYKMLGGAVEFTDFKSIDGIMIPQKQLVYAIKIRKKQKSYLHQLLLSNFKFDDFNPEDLILDKDLKKGGDFKK